MKLGIIGGGVVGSALARCYLEHVDEVRVYDIVKERSSHSLGDTIKCELIFICLPTPMSRDRLGIDASAVYNFFVDNAERLSGANLILKSTVPIGFTQGIQKSFNLSIVHSPEFLTHRCAFTDVQFPSRNIIGSPGFQCNDAVFALNRLYHSRFPSTPIYHLTSDESEALKLFTNSYFAVKVSFFNEINSLCKKLNLNWGQVRKAMLADERIGYSHTQVPGPDGHSGFGGDCLPKDLAELCGAADRCSCPAVVALAAKLRNNLKDRIEK